MAVASAVPYANHLHLAPDRQPRQHRITRFFCRPDALSDAQPTASKHWRQLTTDSFRSTNNINYHQKCPQVSLQNLCTLPVYDYLHCQNSASDGLYFTWTRLYVLPRTLPIHTSKPASDKMKPTIHMTLTDTIHVTSLHLTQAMWQLYSSTNKKY